MGTDTSDPIGGQRPPPAPPKKKTISGPYQSYQIVVSVSTLTELKTMQPPGVDGAPTFFRDNGLPWFWFRNLPAGYVVSADGSNGVVSSNKSGFFVSLFKLVAAVSLGAFLTCARASSSRMLDVPASTLYLVADGARTYVQSFVSGWHWKANFPAATATDNVKTCRPTAWAALGLNGAFVRDLQGDETTRQQVAWFVNSTATDNEGSGSSSDPIQSDDEIGRRWGPSPVLSVPVTISYAQAPTVVTNWNQVGILPGGSLTVSGTPTITKQGTVLTAVQIQVRTPGAELGWAVTAPAFDATDVGKILVITQSATAANVGAYAAIVKDETGGKIRVAPFGVSTPLVFNTITPLVGDVVEVHDGMQLKVGGIEFLLLGQTVASANPLGQAVLFKDIRLFGNGTGHVYSKRCPVFYERCQYDNISFASLANQLSTQTHRLNGGCVMPGGLAMVIRGFTVMLQVGCLGAVTLFGGYRNTFSSDCYFQNCTYSTATGCQSLTSGIAFFDRANANQALTVGTGSVQTQTGGVPDWGTNNAGHGISVASASTYVYASKPTINSGLGAGREAQVGGTDKLYAAIPFIEPANNAGIVISVF